MAEEERQSHTKRSRGVIDRLEDGGTAVVLVGDEEIKIELPAALLPAGGSDGDHLVITVTLDPAARKEAEERIKQLQDTLEQRTGAAGQKNFKL